MTERLQALLPDKLVELVASSPLLQAVLILAGFLLLAKLVDLVITRVLKVWAARSRTDWDDRLIEALHRPVFVSVVLVGLALVTTRLELPETYSLVVLRLLKTLAVLVWLGFGLKAATLVLTGLSRVKGRLPFLEDRTLPLFENTFKLVLVGAAVYFLFLSWNIDIGAWLLSAGVVGIAVGFAAKDTLANLFSGIFILADAPYKVGDFVVLDSGERGQVTQVGLRSTRMLTRDDVEVTVPNAVIANAKIINESGGPWEKARVRLKVGVSYDSDVDRVREALMEAVRDLPGVADNPEPRVRFRAFGDSSLDFELLAWVEQPLLRGRVLDELHMRVLKRFRDDGIEIPFPQRDVHLRREP
jgi:small-conductance mechanosensitive channel